MKISIAILALVISLFISGCVSAPPVMIRGNTVIDNDEVNQKLGKLDIRYGMLDEKGFRDAVSEQQKAIMGDKKMPADQKDKKLNDLKAYRYEVGKWWWVEFMYEKMPTRGDLNIAIFDEKGDNYISHSFGNLYAMTMSMNIGKDIVKKTIYREVNIIETKNPLNSKYITPDRVPVTEKITILKNYKVVNFIIPQ